MGQVAGRLALRVGLKRADEKDKRTSKTVLYCACGEPRLGNSDIICSLLKV
jgi:hypothetical protein